MKEIKKMGIREIGHEALGGGGRGVSPMIEVDHTGQVITPEARQLKRIADSLEKLLKLKLLK